jgi:NTE family protein
MYTIFYFAGERDPREIAQALSQEGKTRWAPGGELLVSGVFPGEDRGDDFRIIFQTHIGRAMHALSHRPFDLLLIDGRRGTGEKTCVPFGETPGGKLLSSILKVSTITFFGIKKRSILIILEEGENICSASFDAGNLRVGGVLVEPFKRGGLLKAIGPFLAIPEGGKIGLCLAGGGVEGLIYELGVLIALDRVMKNRNVADFDVFCGISAGAVISSFLVNGVSPEEIARGLHAGTGRIDRIDRSTIFWPNFREVLPRIVDTVREALRYGKGVDAEALLWGLIPSGAMNAEDLKWYMEKQLTKPGMTNSFHQLGKELYIGVTDQDNSSHVVLGEPGLRDIPISHAVMASTALVPFYHPQRIRDRWYIDGAFTRTANISVAARHGARLIIVVNPWVPYQSRQPGLVNRYGGAFTTLQAIKALVSTRFFQDYENVDELFPDSFIHLFYPEGEELNEMKGTLMKFFFRLRLVDTAYRRTIQKIRERYEIMARDFRKFGIELVDPESLEDEPVMERLEEGEPSNVVSIDRAKKAGAAS